MPQDRFNYFEYHDKWRVKGRVEELTDVLFNRFNEANRWCPNVFIRPPLVLEPGDAQGKGKVVRVLEQAGRFPFTVAYEVAMTEINHPYGWKLQATGDFSGNGEWKFKPDGEWINVTLDWLVQVEKPIVRFASRLAFLRPILMQNHNYAIKMIGIGVQREMDRRSATTPAERALVPAPPRPFMPMFWVSHRW
jgi:hypothetical protein